MAIFCPNCGVELPDGVAFCDACGTRLPQQNRQGGQASGAQPVASTIGPAACPVCGAAALPGEAFCDNCGASLLLPEDQMPISGVLPLPSAQASVQGGIAPPPSYSNAPAAGYSATQTVSTRQAVASIIVNSPPPPATISVPDRAEQIVGRSDSQSNSYPDIDLGPYSGLELGVSRRHFRLKRDGGQFYIEDLGSMNGTVVNGQRITPHSLQPLKAGDRIALGKMDLTFDVAYS